MTRCGIQLARGDHPAAEATCREVTGMMRERLHEGHFGTALGECRWGRALAGQGRLREAAGLFESATPVLEKVPRQLPWEYTRECLETAVSVYEELGREEEAERLRRRLPDIPESVSQVGGP